MTQISKVQAIREGSFGFLVQTIARTLDMKLKIELKELGVDAKLFANLMVLSEEDGINQRQLGKKLQFPEYFTSRNIDALVSAGLAERRPDPNSRRSLLVFLTPEGRATAKRLPPIIKRVNDDVLKGLTESERKTIVDLLQKVAGVGKFAQD